MMFMLFPYGDNQIFTLTSIFKCGIFLFVYSNEQHKIFINKKPNTISDISSPGQYILDREILSIRWFYYLIPVSSKMTNVKTNTRVNYHLYKIY